MAHQGRPGSDDFISLEQHTEILRNIGFNATFVDDIFGEKAKEAISKEICAGPHVTNTKKLGKFKILKEVSVGIGVRRIKAILE